MSAPTLTADQLSTLRHMLGIDNPDARIPVPHRNYAAVVPCDPEFVELERLGMEGRENGCADLSRTGNRDPNRSAVDESGLLGGA